MAYKDKAEKYLNNQILDTDPMSVTARSEYVTRPVDSQSGYEWRDPKTGNILSDTEANQRIYENKTPTPELALEDINVSGDYSQETPSDPLTKTVEDMKREPSSRLSDSDRAMLADLVAAGLPTVSGIVAGSSPTVMMNHYDRQNRYTETRGKQINPSKENLVELMGEDGAPYYELANNSLGKTPYNQPRTASGAINQNGDALFQVRNIEDEFGRPKIVGITKTGKQIDLNARPHMGVGQMVFTDAWGNKTYQQYDKGSFYYGDGTNAPKQLNRDQDPPSQGTSPFKEPGQPLFGERRSSPKNKVAGSSQGYGSILGVPTETIKKADELVDKYGKDLGDIIRQREDLTALEPILRNPNATPREQAVVIQALVQASTVETRMTDEDVNRVTGANLRPIVNDLIDLVSRKGVGGLSSYERKNALETAKTLIKKSNKIEQFYRGKLSQRAEALPGGKRYLESQGYSSKTESTKEIERTLNSARELAKKRFPNNPKMQEEFIKYAEGQL